MLNTNDLLGAMRRPSDEDRFKRFTGCQDRRVTAIEGRPLYLFSFEYSSEQIAEYVAYSTPDGIEVRLIFPYLPSDFRESLGLDADALLPGAPFANLETAILRARTWQSEQDLSLGRDAHNDGISRAGDDKAFLTLDTIRYARLGWCDDRQVYFYRHALTYPHVLEFMVYPAGDHYEAALIAPSLSMRDRWFMKATDHRINLTEFFGEPCINLETAIMRSQLWAEQFKTRLEKVCGGERVSL